VVLNWNQAALTLAAVRAVLGQRPAAAMVVVDNGSRPADRRAVEAGLPAGVALARTGRNLGFAGGMNAGIRHALAGGYEFVWLLNNDCFPDPGCLAALLAAADADPGAVALLPALRDGAGGRHIVGAVIDWRSGRQECVFEQPAGADADRFTLHGSALFVRAGVLRRTGGFDRRFFAYREEDDWCLRAAAGGRLAVVPAATAAHLGGATSGGPTSPLAGHLVARNGWLLLRKHLRPAAQPPALLRYFADRLAEAGRRYADGRPGLAAAVLSGTWDGVRSRYGPPRPNAPPGWLVAAARGCPWRLRQALWRLAALYPVQTPGRRAVRR
jgi:GT2 family glycosyltransferase